MGFMSAIMFEPSNWAEYALCTSCGNVLDLSKINSWKTNMIPGGLRTAKGETIDFNPHNVVCPHCREENTIGNLVIRPKTIGMMDEITIRTPRKDIVKWTPCKPWKTKSGKMMDVRAETEYCVDTRSKVMTKGSYPHLTTTEVAKRLADMVNFKVNLDQVLKALELKFTDNELEESPLANSVLNLISMYGGDMMISMPALRKIKRTGILIIRDSRAWHGDKTGKRKCRVNGKTEWVDLDNWLGDTMKSYVAANPDSIDKVITFLGTLSNDRGKGSTGIFVSEDGTTVRFFDTTENKWIEEPLTTEIRCATYREDMGDIDDEDAWINDLAEGDVEQLDDTLPDDDYEPETVERIIPDYDYLKFDREYNLYKLPGYENLNEWHQSFMGPRK